MSSIYWSTLYEMHAGRRKKSNLLFMLWFFNAFRIKPESISSHCFVYQGLSDEIFCNKEKRKTNDCLALSWLDNCLAISWEKFGGWCTIVLIKYACQPSAVNQLDFRLVSDRTISEKCKSADFISPLQLVLFLIPSFVLSTLFLFFATLQGFSLHGNTRNVTLP